MTRQEDKGVAIAVPGEDWALEGVFVRGPESDPPGAVIAPPHPLYGGSMDSPVVAELAFGMKRAGYATLRFNWRGVGASGGESSGDPAQAGADYAAALEHLADTVPGPLLAAGYSFGAAAALRAGAASARVRRLVLVAPPPSFLDADALAAFRGRVLVLSGARDSLAPPTELEALLGDDPRRRLEVVPAADHFFASGLSELSRRTCDWLGPA